MIASTQTNHPLQGSGEPLDPQKRVEAACVRLREAGLRITQPRIAILGVLIARSQPVSIEQTHADLRTRSCDLVTVYRCLAAFEEIGLVRRSFLHNGTSLYQLADRKDNAYHVVAKNGEEIRALDTETSARLAAAIKVVEDQLKTEGYSDVSHLLEFFAKAPASPAAAARTRAGQVKIPVTQ
jgi:Fur family transcriptional regulator, ferric uptake regulator